MGTQAHRERGGKNLQDSNSYFCCCPGWGCQAHQGVQLVSPWNHERWRWGRDHDWELQFREARAWPGLTTPWITFVNWLAARCLWDSDNGSPQCGGARRIIAWPFSLFLSRLFSFLIISRRYLHVRGRNKLGQIPLSKMPRQEKQLELNKVTLLFGRGMPAKNRLWLLYAAWTFCWYMRVLDVLFNKHEIVETLFVFYLFRKTDETLCVPVSGRSGVVVILETVQGTVCWMPTCTFYIQSSQQWRRHL